MPATLYWHKADDLQGKAGEDGKTGEKDSQGARGNFWKKWTCLLSWQWWWFHRCLHVSKSIRFYTLDACHLLHVNSTSTQPLKKNASQKGNRGSSLLRALWQLQWLGYLVRGSLFPYFRGFAVFDSVSLSSCSSPTLCFTSLCVYLCVWY